MNAVAHWLSDRDHRKYLYGVSLVGIPLLVFYGVISESAAPLWIAAAGGVLTPGLALNHLPDKEDDDAVQP